MNLMVYKIKRYSCLLMAASVMVHTMGATAPTAAQLAEFQKQYEQAVAAQKAHHVTLANTLLASKPSVFDQINKKTIIGANEWSELQLTDLVKVCGKPETSFGTKGLEWLLIPIADTQEIIRRQTIIKSLVEEPALFGQLQTMLQEIEKSEASVLMYWDKQDLLMLKFDQFYYKILPGSMNKSFNKSPLALNFGIIQSVINHSSDFLTSAFLSGTAIYMMKWAWQSKTAPMPFSLSDCLKLTFKEPLRDVNPFPGDNHDADDGNGTVFLAAWQGTLGDRFWAVKDSIEETLGRAKRVAGQFPALWEGDVRTSVGFTSGALFAVGMAVSGLLTKKFLAERSINAIRLYVADMFMLRANLKQIATFIRSLEKFETEIGRSPVLRAARTNRYLAHVMNKNNWSAQLRQLADILSSSMFNESQKLFLPGQIFAAHTLMQEVKGELVPAMQAIAEFDAYLSLAKLMKENQSGKNTYSFVEFVDQESPMIMMDEVWTPFVGVQHAVSNPVVLGVSANPIRMLITGPNGGGKSIYFTALGQAVLMAHSWGIAPARSARMTVFNQIRTSFAPKEDKLHGISKFMAQKRHIAGIEKLITTSSANNKMLVLLDEPFDGTTEHLMAERVYDFGVKVKQLPHVVVGIATHVKKPIELARDGLFKNYHVGIEEPELGVFERTFKLEEGPAEWWFADQTRGARYQDWLDIYMQRRAASQMLQVA